MASPIHKFLFSPPPSPPLAPGAKEDPNGPFTSLRTLLSPLPGKNKSTFEQQQQQRPDSVLSASSSSMTALDVESGDAAGTATAYKQPKQSAASYFSPARLRLSASLYGSSVPRPLVRLVMFVAIFLSCVMLFNSIPMPSSVSNSSPLMGGQRIYQPPQSHRAPLVAAPPRTERPQAHPLPPTHELLALQSFIIDSPYSHLSHRVDASKPLEASMLLGSPGARRLGEPGSERAQRWLSDIEREAASNVVLWYSSTTVPHYALEDVSARHGQGRRARTISLASRKDGDIIRQVFARLGHNLDEAPLLVVGGEVITATPERMDELRASGELAEKLVKIGWRR